MKSRIIPGLAGLALIAGISGCAAQASTVASEPKPDREPQSWWDKQGVDESDVPAEEPEPEVVLPDPDGKYSWNCDYVLGNFTAGPNGYRFIGDARVKNVGNVGIVAEVKAKWLLLGGGDVKDTKTVRIGVDESKRVNFNISATSDQIDRHQAITRGRTCAVNVSLVDTFGDPVA